MNDKKRDHELGMDRSITRRDFLNGVALTVGGTLVAPQLLNAFDKPQTPATGEYYPPALMGMRGNHEGTYTYAHQLRDGIFQQDTQPQATGEEYDLVIVGGGISGLAAAHFYRKKVGPNAKILILDNHDDFGGHAKRNEFQAGGRMLLGYGGTQSIESPSEYSDVAKGVLKEIGVETKRFYKDYDQKLYSKLGTANFFDKETFGEDRLVPGMFSTPWQEWVKKTPLSEAAQRDIARVYTEKVDYLPGLSLEEKRAKLAKTSYADYLTKFAKCTPEVLPFFKSRTNDLFCVNIGSVPTLDILMAGDDYGIHYAGLDGLGLGNASEGRGEEKQEPYIFHFPDGNASVARLLVRHLIPDAMPGHTMEDVVTTHADYSKLDRDSSPVRIRLNSTVVRAKHVGDPATAKQVEVHYMQNGKLQSIVGKACVMACYNMMVPYLCPELPDKQKDALGEGVKAPLVYTHVAIRNWQIFEKLGFWQVVCPGSYHVYVALDFPVNIGTYKFPSHPDEPMVLFMLRTPNKPGLSQKDQYRAGRMELFTTPYETFERNIREQLARMFGKEGFDPARDIAGITVNRWAHGYAYGYNSLFDPDLPQDQRPHVIGRKSFGRISIANSDAAATAYTDAAIDQAYRAVNEVLTLKG
jgi:spermidine dehydrogenase